MVSLAMEAAMMSTMYFFWDRCAQHGRGACGGGLVCVSLRSYRALVYLYYQSKGIVRFWSCNKAVTNVFPYKAEPGGIR